MAPPVSVSRVCRDAPASARGNARPIVLASSETIACSGSDAAIAAARFAAPNGSSPSAATVPSALAGTGATPAATSSASSSNAAPAS
jgi:hypothetical protein